MKRIKYYNMVGMISVIAAFVAMAMGAVLNLSAVFFIGVVLLLASIILTVVLPGLVTTKWTRLMQDHGVPAEAILIKCVTVARSTDARLEFKVLDTDITTAAIVSGGAKNNYTIDSRWNIKYDPDETEYCLIVNEIPQNEEPTEPINA